MNESLSTPSAGHDSQQHPERVENPLYETHLRDLHNLGFERFGHTDVFLKEGFVIQVENDGRIHVLTDYADTGGGEIVGIEAPESKDQDKEGLLHIVSRETRGSSKDMINMRTSDYGGSGNAKMRTPGQASSELQRFQGIAHTQQLVNAGFKEVYTSPAEEKKMQVFSRDLNFHGKPHQIFALVEGGVIKRLVRLPGVEIVEKITPGTRVMHHGYKGSGRADDPPVLGLRNAYSSFVLESNGAGGRLVGTELLRELTPEELGIPHVKERREGTGFVIGGRNETSLIRGLTSINGISIVELEAIMRPGTQLVGASTDGFLREGTKLLNLLCADNDAVLSQGLTHQDLANPLKYAREIYRKELGSEFILSGVRYKMDAMGTRSGAQKSPFRDGTGDKVNATVTNLENGESVWFSFLHADMIERYGFYEDEGLPYRVDPLQIIKVFPWIKNRGQQRSAEKK